MSSATTRDAGPATAPVTDAPGATGSGSPPARRSPLRVLTGHLSFRLFLVLLALLALLQALHAGLLAREQKRQLMDTILVSAGSMSDVIQRSTRVAMLRNQRAELHEMIQSIGNEPGIAGVRVFNKRGEIVFSTDKAEVGRVVDRQAEACYRCHAPGMAPRPTLERADRARIFGAPDGQRLLGLIAPVPNATDCSSADCHAHSPEQTVLGVLDVRMSLASADAQVAATQRRMRNASVGLVLAVALLFAFAIYRLVQVPVGRLMDGTRAVSQGQLDHRIAMHSGDDLGALAASFDTMTEGLQRAEAVNRGWALTLEEKVREKSEELQRAQAHLMQMDKMASLGKLATTVAHEINNPLAGILTYARLLERDMGTLECAPDRRAHLERSLGTIAAETRRCGGIVQNLLTFARTSGAQMVPASLDPLLEAGLGIAQHHFELAGIEVVRHLNAGSTPVVCAPGEIQQAVLALLVNAAEAMPAGGTLEVATAVDAQEARIRVADQGVGIPPDVLPHIFEPFYTTKSAAKGVGLGLAVVYGIMQRHGGRVEVQSAIDRGSAFTLVWPRRGAAPPPVAEAQTGASASVGGET